MEGRLLSMRVISFVSTMEFFFVSTNQPVADLGAQWKILFGTQMSPFGRHLDNPVAGISFLGFLGESKPTLTLDYRLQKED